MTTTDTPTPAADALAEFEKPRRFVPPRKMTIEEIEEYNRLLLAAIAEKKDTLADMRGTGKRTLRAPRKEKP